LDSSSSEGCKFCDVAFYGNTVRNVTFGL